MKFCLKNAFDLCEVYAYGKKDGKVRVVGFRATFNPLYDAKMNEARKSYNELVKQKKELGKYLAMYRDKSPNVFRDSYYVSQLTILEGLKARAKQNAAFLKKLKWIKSFGTGQADIIAKSISGTVNLDGYNKSKDAGWKAASSDFKSRLANIGNFLGKNKYGRK